MKKFREFFSRIGYAIIPFIVLGLLIFITFFGNNYIYKLGWTEASAYHVTEIDSSIPLVPWFIYFYFLTFPVAIFMFFYLAYKNKKAFYNLFITLIIAFTLSGFIYFFAQTILTKPEFTAVTFTDKLVTWTWGSTAPVCNFPSQHCFMAFATIIAAITATDERSGKRNRTLGFMITLIAIMIAASTVLTKQHYFLDILASFDIVFITYPIIRLFRVGERIVARQEKRIEKRKLKKLEKMADK